MKGFLVENERGQLGLVTSDERKYVVDVGDQCYVGVTFPGGDPWYSRSPKVVGPAGDLVGSKRCFEEWRRVHELARNRRVVENLADEEQGRVYPSLPSG